MTSDDKATDASKVDLTDEELDGANGGAGYIKLGDIEGTSKLTGEVSLNFGKIQDDYRDLKSTALKGTTSKLKW